MRRYVPAIALVLVVGLAAAVFAQRRQPTLDEPFRGVTADGTVVPDLYEIRATGVSTAPVVEAAEAFLATLAAEQTAASTFAVDADEWRLWHNIHRYDRAGISRAEMTDEQEEAAMALLRAGLSLEGFAKARDIMRLNGYLGELTGRTEEYGEGMYHFTVMGTPSTTDPWGWQLDGHHLVINFFVLGDQVVMTPAFMGSEPVAATSGPWAGTRVFGPEESAGMALMRTLDQAQQERAIVGTELPRNVYTAAFNDNTVVPYEGLPAAEMNESQRELLVALIGEYVGNLRDEHAEVWLRDVKEHLDDTYFAWAGGTGDDAVFYYRVQSPVILIEFDHQGGVALDSDGPSRDHVHSVTRTPNGNDYGKDLLRQHHERYAHVDGRHVPRQAEEH